MPSPWQLRDKIEKESRNHDLRVRELGHPPKGSSVTG